MGEHSKKAPGETQNSKNHGKKRRQTQGKIRVQKKIRGVKKEKAFSTEGKGGSPASGPMNEVSRERDEPNRHY